MIFVLTFRLPLEDDKMSPLLKEPQKSGRIGHNFDDNFVIGHSRSFTDIDAHIPPGQILDTTSLDGSTSSNRVVTTQVEDDGLRDRYFDSGTRKLKYLPIDASSIVRIRIEQRGVNGAECLIL